MLQCQHSLGSFACIQLGNLALQYPTPKATTLVGSDVGILDKRLSHKQDAALLACGATQPKPKHCTGIGNNNCGFYPWTARRLFSPDPPMLPQARLRYCKRERYLYYETAGQTKLKGGGGVSVFQTRPWNRRSDYWNSNWASSVPPPPPINKRIPGYQNHGEALSAPPPPPPRETAGQATGPPKGDRYPCAPTLETTSQTTKNSKGGLYVCPNPPLKPQARLPNF